MSDRFNAYGDCVHPGSNGYGSSEPIGGYSDRLADERRTVAMDEDFKEYRDAIEAMLPWALIGLNEQHPAIQFARRLGLTATVVATDRELSAAIRNGSAA